MSFRQLFVHENLVLQYSIMLVSSIEQFVITIVGIPLEGLQREINWMTSKIWKVLV